MTGTEATHGPDRIRDLVAAAQAGDEQAFAALVERYGRELQVHCYRMLGSFDDSEDLVQETFLRAWRKRASFSFDDGRGTFRAWLYKIATNACLDALKRKPRRLLPSQLGPPADPADPGLPPPVDLPWLQPYPGHLLEGIAPSEDDPEAVVVARETMELAFLATIQLLPPRQRAVLILRDVLGWSAKESASLIDASVASVNSALQRARATLRDELPARRLDWAPSSDPSAEEREVLARFMAAFERRDLAAVAAVLSEDVRGIMPPYPFWFAGRDANLTALAPALDPASEHYLGDWRVVPTSANLQPAGAFYVRRPRDTEFRAFALDVLRVEGGEIVEITSFAPDRFASFGLPATL
jgi:RNA polymerase sigma-70 factor (ECF subfamily)